MHYIAENHSWRAQSSVINTEQISVSGNEWTFNLWCTQRKNKPLTALLLIGPEVRPLGLRWAVQGGCRSLQSGSHDRSDLRPAVLSRLVWGQRALVTGKMRSASLWGQDVAVSYHHRPKHHTYHVTWWYSRLQLTGDNWCSDPV